jgi:hypothetical protein
MVEYALHDKGNFYHCESVILGEKVQFDFPGKESIISVMRIRMDGV